MTPPPLFSVGVLVAMATLVGVVLGSDRGGGGPEIRCGNENLTDRHGVIQTPNFPQPPPLPLHCRWVINASWADERNVTVYLTQQYVLSGLTIYHYDNVNANVNDNVHQQLIYGGPNDSAIATEYVRSNRPYVAVELDLTTLVGNHLRVLKDLQEVYGFNITYEVTFNGEADRGSCSPIICGFVGECRASLDFKNYSCECPHEYSGPNCNLGPMCEENPCQNGGKCRSTGTESIVCKCEGNFTGVFCQYPPIGKEVKECQANGGKVCGNSSGSEVQPGRMLYTVNLSISDKYRPTSSLRYTCDTENLNVLLSLVTYESLLNLRSNLELALNLTINNLMSQDGLLEIYDLVIIDITPRGEMTFQFKTYEGNSPKVSVVLNNLLVVSSHQPLVQWSPKTFEDGQVQNCMEREIYLLDGMSVTYHPALYLQKVVPNNVEPMLPGKQQVFSCVVTGSPNISFSWFKDNQLVIPGKSSRIWTQIFWGTNNTITSFLGVDNVTPLDDGRWTCVVRDGLLQQSRSVDSYVLQSPSVHMLPPMNTTRKGGKVFLSCILSHYGHVWRNEHGYSWTRNGVPLSSGGDHVIEPLDYPNGCLLRIQNINESATYTCHVKSDVGRASASARVEVFTENPTICNTDDNDWPSVPVDTVAMIECPEGLLGSVAKRRCSAVMHPTSSRISSQWNDPDYSACVPTEAVRLVDDLKEISQGYAPSTPAQVLKELFFLIVKRTSLRTRQGEALLAIAMDAWKVCGDSLQIQYQMLRIVDFLLKFPRAIASPKYIGGISKVAEKAAIARMKLRQSAIPFVSLQTLSVSYLDPNATNKVVHLEETRPSWCAALHYSSMERHLSIPIVALEFKTVQDIIPYNSRLNSSDVFYQILSTIVITSLAETVDEIAARKYATNRTNIEITFENTPVSLTSFLAEYHDPYWNITCAYAQSIEYSPVQWDLGSCTTKISKIDEGDSSRFWLPWTRAKALASLRSELSVRCFCPVPGTYAVLLAGFTQKPDGEVSSVAVVLALWCCAVEATAALILPFVSSWRGTTLKASQSQITASSQVQSQNSSVTATTTAKTSASEAIIFKAFHVTACTNTALFAIIMALTMCKWDTVFPGVLLQCLLLLGISMPTAQLYLTATELGAFPVFPVGNLWPKQYSRSLAVAVALSIGPVVVFLILWLSIRDLRATLSHCWTSWMEWREPVSWAVAIPSSVMATAGVVMYGMCRRLTTMTTYSKGVQSNARSGLVFRLCAIVVCQLAFLLTTIFYTSAPGLASHVALVVASFLLGYSLLLCYVLRLDKQWPLLSVAWCKGEEDLVDSAQTLQASTSSTGTAVPGDCWSKWRRLYDILSRRKRVSSLPNQSGALAPSATTTPALESPDSLRPLIVSPVKSKLQSNGGPKKAIRFVSGSKCTQPLLTSLPSSSKSDTYRQTSRSGDSTGGRSVPLREFETSSLKKFNGYLSMRGWRPKVTSAASTSVPVRGDGYLGALQSKRSGTCSTTNSAPEQSTSRPQYHFRRRFLRLDDIEESSSAS